jgi:probable rRNA maturation factor
VVSLGDIVISLEKAAEQANEYGHSFEREVAFLTVHSMLHLLGYDHMDEDEERDMRARQRAVMELLGLTVASSEE